MRSFVPLLLCAALLLTPGLIFAEDAPAEPKPAEDKPAPLAKPSKAWGAINMASRRVPRAERREMMKAAAREYLAEYDKRRGAALGSEALRLGYIQRAAETWKAAAGSFRSVWSNEELEDGLRDQGAYNEVRVLGSEDARTALGAEPCAKTIGLLLAYAQGMGVEGRLSMRSRIEGGLAGVLTALERKKEAKALRLALIERDPMQTSRQYSWLVWDLLNSTHAMEDYEQLRAEAKPLLDMLVTQQKKAADIAQAKLDAAIARLKEVSPDSVTADGKLKPKPTTQMNTHEQAAYVAQRAAGPAKSYIERIEGMHKPFRMLGEAAPAWTLEHAFGSTKSLGELRGKVVLLDFWATWCPWCIRSFPAIRDLLRDYEKRGLVVVGVTASAGRVYTERYDLDDDFKDKVEAGKRAQPAAMIATTRNPADGVKYFEPEAYKAKEIEVIGTFVGNHKMTWPVVMIDKADPGPKYALGGWPHAVVIDRQGRVRYFKSGALLRDDPAAVKEFRKVLETLLAERTKPIPR